ncbi:MAG: sugar transferase [Nocardioidaceae bacterium]
MALFTGSAAYLTRTAGTDAVAPGYLMMSLLFPMVWLSVITLTRAYEPRFLHVGSEEFRRIAQGGLGFALVAAFASFALGFELARGYLSVLVVLATTGTLCTRLALRKRLHRQRSSGVGWMRRVLVVGQDDGVRHVLAELGEQRWHGYQAAGVCLDEPATGQAYHVPVVVGLENIPAAAARVDADTVVVQPGRHLGAAALRRLGWQLEGTGTRLLVAPGLTDVAHRRTTVHPVGTLPLLHVDHPELTGFRRLAKDVVDRVAAAAGLLVLFPMLLVLMAAVRLDSRGPSVFRQHRVGRADSRFTMYKLRTMTVDAEARRHELVDLNESDGAQFKIRDDPRVTRVGRVLRRYSLDELPQLYNVLLGHMSLVGPRPPLLSEVDEYDHDVRRRLVVKPGLTGLWQVSGRSDLPWEEAVRLDLRYVDNWSPLLDMSIIWKTGRAVLSRSGAY